MFKNLQQEAEKATAELCETARLHERQLLIVGCSTSEVCGDMIGTNSNLDAAKAVFTGIYNATHTRGIWLAVQCCEHLNRAIILEREAAGNRDIVNVVPHPKAGGAFATAAWEYFKHPVAVEHIRADAGLDIGDTLIGMHLKDVAVPVRLETRTIGNAHLTAARVRPKFIGGIRAKYDDELM